MSYKGFDHVHLWVSNAKQAAAWYILRWGFEPMAYRGLETGSRDVATHVIRQNEIVFAFSSPLNPVETEMSKRIAIKGDAVKDVAFTVADCKAIYEKAIERGAKSVMAPTEEKDEHGSVISATVQTYGDTVHTFIQRVDYKGPFLPGFRADTSKELLTAHMPSPGLIRVDHVVGNQPDLKMESVTEWYEKILGFRRFWSVDDKTIHTEYSSLRSIVVTDPEEKVKMPINEPASGKRKSQIQEYVDYHGEGGVQHVALLTDDIIHAVSNLRARGVEFLKIPKTYYEDLAKRLEKSPTKILEPMDKLQELGILIDFDDHGYLLQLFSNPVQDRPTLFYEVIQRRNHQGFGAGNFKALFEAIERAQELRGNLTEDKPAAESDHKMPY